MLVNIQRLAAGVLYLLGICTNVMAYQPEDKPDNAWSRIKSPTDDVPMPIGSYANGCMAGARALPSSSTGYIDMRRNRNRYYGHPDLIHFIEQLGEHTYHRYQRKHLIGDLSQPRGGRMNFGHSSHQIGLDVDIWMQTVTSEAQVNPYRDMQSIVDKIDGVIIDGAIEPATRDALYFAATYPQTARIFVNPVIKWHLCQMESDTAWLHKIRPWWGHHQHFHVRLSCPQDSPLCKNQKAIPAGDGCDDNLWHWVDEQSGLLTGRIKPKPKRKKRLPKPMPEQCDDVNMQ